MEVYKIQVAKADISEEFREAVFHFESKELAIKLMRAFNQMTAPGKTIEWNYEIIHIMNEEDVIKQIESIALDN